MDEIRVNSAGIFVGRESIFWVILESQSDGKIEVKDIEKLPFISPLDYSNFISQENRIKIFNILQKSVANGIFNERRINLTFDSRLTYPVKLPIERTLHPEELKDHLIWEFEQHFLGEKLSDYSVSYQPVNIYEDGTFDSIIFLAIKKVIINFFNHILEDFKLKIKTIDIDHFAAETICKAIFPEFETSNNFLVSYKKECLDVSFIQNGRMISYRKIPFENENEILNYFEKELVPVLKSMKNKLRSIYIWGEGLSSRMVDELDSITPIKVVTINPFKNFIINKKVLNSPVFENLQEFTPACGIALRL